MKNSSINNDLLNHIIETQSRLAQANFNLEVFMQLVVEQMEQLTPATGVVVELVDNDEMVYRAASGTVAPHLGLRININASISGLCIKNNEILRSNDTETDPRVDLNACRLVQARSMIVAPLIYEGKALGVLKILSTQPHGFNDEHEQTLQLMAGLIAAGLGHQILYHEKTYALEELARAQEKLKHLAHYDPLTDLPNRRLFSDVLSKAMAKSKRHKKLLALMFLDVDHFKTINDTLGHDIGDELLKIFSMRLKQSIREYDTVARLGGDEFIILLDDLESPNTAIAIANKILENTKQRFTCQNQDLVVTTSIGLAFYWGTDESPDELIKLADEALYKVKKAGRNAFSIAEKTLVQLEETE